MKLLMMFYIVLAGVMLVSAFMDWLEWLNEPITFGEYVDDLEEMLDNNTSEVGCMLMKIKCNAFKYRFRAGRKDGNSAEQDIKKAEWYEEYLLRMVGGDNE